MNGHELTLSTDGQVSNCPRRGIRYIPKRSQHEPTSTTTHGPEPTATGIPFLGRGNMIVSTLGHIRGCIISHGTWYASGTCATFRAEKARGLFLCSHRDAAWRSLAEANQKLYIDDTFTLKSSKGPCSVEADVFSCGVHVNEPSEFSVRGLHLFP